MKPIYTLIACLVLAGVVRGQTGSANPDSSANDTNLAAEIKALREALLQTQKQMAAQQREIEALKEGAKAEQTASAGNQHPPSMIDAAMHTAIPSSPGLANSSIVPNVSSQPVAQEQAKESQKPLGSFNIGDAVFIPGGFVDF